MTPRVPRLFASVLAAALMSLLLPAEGFARVERYAVIVGNNEGATGEARLRYAEDDARKVYEVLKALGDFRPENMVLLVGDTGKSFERVMIEVNARLRSKKTPASQAVLLVYYSGHADALSLHLGQGRLELGRLEGLVRGSAADFRMLLLDACRSGALTRVKGGLPTAPFDIRLDARLAGEGVATLTSSSANEDAQESDELRGSFFTHYLVSGLRGPADRNNDGTVSVEEAYGYAYHHTLSASSQTLHGIQHPTFSFDVKGRGALSLTFLSRRGGRQARLGFPPGRTYLLFARGVGGPVIAEVNQHDRRREIAVEAGTYFVRGRAPDHLLEGMVHVQAGASVLVEDHRLERVEYARLARKGGAGPGVAHGPWLGYQVRTPLWPGATVCHGVRLGYAFDTAWLTLTPRVGGCRSSYSNEVLEAQSDELDADIAVARVFDLPWVSLGVGLALGGAWLRQTFETAGLAPGRDTASAQADGFLDIWWDLSGGFYVLGEAAAHVSVFREQPTSDSPEQTTAQLTARGILAVGKRFSM